jgi:hypothetical protein
MSGLGAWPGDPFFFLDKSGPSTDQANTLAFKQQKK